jgi:signal transduction histidine kinase
MHSLPQLTLLHGNGYKALAARNDGQETRLLVPELQEKIARVGDGDLNTTAEFADRGGEMGALGRKFNHMVEQLRDRRDQLDRLHRSQISRAEHMATVGEVAAGQIHELRNGIGAIAGWIEIAGRDLPVTSPARDALKDAGLEIAHMRRLFTDLLEAARPHPAEVCTAPLKPRAGLSGPPAKTAFQGRVRSGRTVGGGTDDGKEVQRHGYTVDNIAS